ncbi:tyrosine-type recombinase/integrase [Pseudomonas lactis]|uniref:tyrosine-type recombinase/integrase n=1 Tax=Pseudomonas lactis TaxID=1615674 RepID=UPI001475EE8F|nr:site-specific integrase [Pseudomonas lactis]
MTQRNNLYRRSSGIYVLRITVPTRYRVQLGQREIHTSTQTTDLSAAKAVALHLMARWHSCISELKKVNETKVIEGSPLLAGPGLISIQDFCETFEVEPALVLGEIVNHNVLIACWLSAQPIYWVDDYTLVDRQEDTNGFVLDSAFELGIPQTFTGHLRPFHRSHTIANIIEYGYSDETAFRFNLNTRTAAFCDLPGIRFTTSSVFITKIQAEKIRAPWVKALAGKAALRAATAAPMTLISAPSSPATVSYECCRSDRAKELVSSLMEQFLTRKQIKWKPDQHKRMATQCGAFVDLMNDPPLGSLNRQLIWDYETKLRKMPENRYSAARRHKTQDANQLLAMAEKHGETRLSSASVERYMDSLSSMFAWAVDNMILTLNPAKRAIEKSKKITRNQDDRFLFEKSYLDKIFSAPWFSTGTGERNKQGRFYQFRPHFYWLPLLGLYTGGRINELCQLYIDDIKLSKSGVCYLDFNLDTPDKMDTDVRDGAETAGSDKTLKTVNSRRIIALHPHLIELGFPAYVKALSEAGHNRLFPELKRDSIKGYGKPAGSWFNERFLGKQLLVPRDGKRTFHSFRHNFITALNEQEVPPDIIAQLAGHIRGETETAGRYRKDTEADRLLAYIKLLNYELPHIKPFIVNDGLDAIKDALRRKKKLTYRSNDINKKAPHRSFFI